jgi:membrane fusion protein (multidrug efflux system)
VLVLHTSCESKKEHKEEEIKFLVTSPIKMDTFFIRDYVCQIRAIQHIELRALERGYLQDIYVDEGQLVKKGQTMFQIMPNLYQAELQKAQAEANFVQIEYQNTKDLADGNIVSKTELALAKAKLDKANAEVALAQVHLNFTRIKAPFDGIMDRFQVRQGSLLDEGDLLTTLSDNRKMWVYFNVPEAEYLDYKSSINKDSLMRVRLMMANNKLFDQIGLVEVIEADFNNETGNIAFRATFLNPDGLLRHGETGNVQMTISIDNELIIPQKATFEVLEKRYVFVVNEKDEVEQREVKIGAEIPDLYMISSGLLATDKIVLEGIRKVRHGQKIHYEFQDPKTVLPRLNVYVE